MQKAFLYFLVLLLFTSSGFAQSADSLHVKWTTSVQKTGDSKFTFRFSGNINDGWHLYKANADEGLGGITVSYPDSSIKADAAQVSGNPMNITDPVFEKLMLVYSSKIDFSQNVTFEGNTPSKISIKLSYEAADKDNFIPEEQSIELVLDSSSALTATAARLLIPSIDLKNPVADCGGLSTGNFDAASSGLMSIFFLGFIGGLIALLTPCVFPMIPLTVSFFTKKSGSNKGKGIFHAFLYGFFILLIYVLLSLPFHFLDQLNPEILNNISTNVYLNVFFFAIFVLFAFSFFGFYELTLPSSITNKADSKSSAGTLIGIFFMALTLAIVSFSCTGPILGSLLAGSLSRDGGAIQLTMGMAGFGLALALPFALFALFPNWLNSLPKSGGWLNTVKVVLGFLELGLALKFLSNADLVMHWGLLKREVFIGIWVLLGIGLTLYLFGKIRFPHDSPVKKLHPFRLSLAVISGLFTLYLIPGLTNTSYANRPLISGFPPPLSHSIYQQKSDCLLGLNCTHDYEEGLKMAKAQNKPMLIDFTGYACVNCRRMEENVWSQDEVLSLMKENFIVVSLYVDDKKKLPLDQQFTYTTRDGVKKEIKTVGDKWATFETENFQNNAQPLYAILDTNEVLMNHPVDYTPNVDTYRNWLQCGLDTFLKK
ncbi:MAG: DUF255 domain-containing protein [Chitinophagaceae bacterium]|nr:MAG: DUF255 domain-containing protein [Chitinophagaceae bacterium]